MDPKHREELEHNDLEHFFTHFKEWWAKYQNPVLITVLVVVGSFSIYTIITNNRIASRNAAWSELANSSSPEALASVAAAQDNATVRHLASLRAADQLLVRVITGGEDPMPMPNQPEQEAEVVETPVDPEADLREAGRLYQQVAADGEAHPVYRLNARLGLAAVAEAEQDWPAAREQYQTILDTAGDHQPAIRGQAQTRLALLPRLEQPLVYAPATENESTGGDATPGQSSEGTSGDASGGNSGGTSGGDDVIHDLLDPEAINELMQSTPDTQSESESDASSMDLDLDLETDTGDEAAE